jgi:hypothetical protein
VIITVIVPAGSAVEYERRERYIGKGSKEAVVPFFLKERSICVSPGVTEEDHTNPPVSRLCGCNLEKFSQQIGRVTLGLLFSIRFPSFINSSCRWEAVLVNHVICKIIIWLIGLRQTARL